MQRIISPRGLFLASVHGEFAAFSDPVNSVDTLMSENDGIYDRLIDSNLDGIAPDGYYRVTYQTQEYTKSVFGRHFDILEYVERGFLNYQDIVVMNKHNFIT